jgi:23S rRNA pseudouridine2605 synthase
MASKNNHTSAHDGERIAKVMSRAGLTSRREAEAWIAAGRVAVNGAVIASPALNIGPNDRVVVDGQPLPTRERTRLFLFNKPRGLVTASADPEGRPTIFGALPKHLPRLITIGRLDLNTEGLLLLTNDGGLARALELPQTGWLRRYRVRAHGQVTQAQLDTLRAGITVEGVRYGSIEAVLDRDKGANVWITFAMREGKNREVRNVLGALGLSVARLIRVSFGPFQLGELPAGQTEEVKTRILRDQLGEKLARLAGADFSAPVFERAVERPQAPGGERPEVRHSVPTRPAPLATLPLGGRDKKHERRGGAGDVARAESRADRSSRPAHPTHPPQADERKTRRAPRSAPDRSQKKAKPVPGPDSRERQVFQGGKPWQPRDKAVSRRTDEGAKAPPKSHGKPPRRGRPYHGKRGP